MCAGPIPNGAPVCPHCGGLDPYDCRRPSGAPRFECRACKKDFSITSGTLFASHKLPLRSYLAAIAVFCNEVKGKSALALSRDLGLSYKTAFVLLHKCREAMAEEMKGRVVGGEGKEAEIDGGYFGGYVKPANQKEHRRDRRLIANQSGKRKGCRHHPGTRRRIRPGSLRVGKRSRFIHPRSHRQGDNSTRGRS
jgi:transposase-like protein